MDKSKFSRWIYYNSIQITKILINIIFLFTYFPSEIFLSVQLEIQLEILDMQI